MSHTTDRVRVQVTFTRASWTARGLGPRTTELAGPREWVRDHLTSFVRSLPDDAEVLGSTEVAP